MVMSRRDRPGDGGEADYRERPTADTGHRLHMFDSNLILRFESVN